MATATVDSRNRSINAADSGKFTGDGAATTLKLGYNPSYIVVVNETDTIRWEKIKGMAAANSMKLTGTPTFAIDTGSAILFNGDGTVTLSATLGANAKAISWYAER